ncbi:ribosome assembly RNA-binding protein YhbY [Liquorilactobacillus uvarum]|uniref:ribosome assembly RNA-binding protein YhbY n=1 Tax=Liquorilactobacillus uvarum TaxID=303240 RepID=UPI00288A457D|nr:ribosome assembly RNA-binding protein YhbY [Liquorilactobacillus uvarum]
MSLTGKQKRFLRAQAHSMKPLFQIGKEGLNTVWVKEVKNALNKRELIKINLLQNAPSDTSEVREYLETKTDFQVVQEIGHILVLYRQADSEKNRDISIKLKEL